MGACFDDLILRVLDQWDGFERLCAEIRVYIMIIAPINMRNVLPMLVLVLIC